MGSVGLPGVPYNAFSTASLPCGIRVRNAAALGSRPPGRAVHSRLSRDIVRSCPASTQHSQSSHCLFRCRYRPVCQFAAPGSAPPLPAFCFASFHYFQEPVYFARVRPLAAFVCFSAAPLHLFHATSGCWLPFPAGHYFRRIHPPRRAAVSRRRLSAFRQFGHSIRQRSRFCRAVYSLSRLRQFARPAFRQQVISRLSPGSVK